MNKNMLELMYSKIIIYLNVIIYNNKKFIVMPWGIRAITSTTLLPIYKEQLNALNQKTKLMSIKNVNDQSVSSIYKCIIEHSKISNKKNFSVDIEGVQQNTTQVISGLNRLFPDSEVSFCKNKIHIDWQ